MDLFEDWLRNKNLKERTIENYIYYFNKFTYDRFNQENISKFLSLKQNRNSVCRGFLVNFKRFLKVNSRELRIDSDYLEEINEVELPKLTGRTTVRLIRPIPHEQILSLEKYLDTESLKLQLLLSYYCGLRLGELLKITIMSFDWDGWKKDTSKMGECRVYGKGDKEGIALVPPLLMTRVARFCRTGHFPTLSSRLFITDKEQINLKNRSRIWQLKLRKAGIDSGVTKLDGEGRPIKDSVVHPHRLRHSYAHYLMNEKKMNIREVQELLRHASIQSTQIYTYIDKEKLKEKLVDL